MRLSDRFGTYGTSIADAVDWREQAACRDHDPELWFPSIGDREKGAEHAAYDKPRRICAHCPVWPQCRAYALESDERYGMWGGLSPRQRSRALGKGAA